MAKWKMSFDFFGMMKKDEDRERVMKHIDKNRAKSLYPHLPEDCSDTCKARGLNRNFVIYADAMVDTIFHWHLIT